MKSAPTIFTNTLHKNAMHGGFTLLGPLGEKTVKVARRSHRANQDQDSGASVKMGVCRKPQTS